MSTLEKALQAEAEIVSRRVIERDGGHLDINRHAHGGVTLGCRERGCTLVVRLEPGQASEVGETLVAFDAAPHSAESAMSHLRGLGLTLRQWQTLRGLVADECSRIVAEVE